MGIKFIVQFLIFIGIIHLIHSARFKNFNESDLNRQMNNFLSTNQKSHYFDVLLAASQKGNLYAGYIPTKQGLGEAKPVQCGGCKLYFNKLIKGFRSNPSLINDIIAQVNNLCAVVNPRTVCEKTMAINKDTIIAVLNTDTTLTGDVICGFFVPGCGKVTASNININIDPSTESITASKSTSYPRESESEIKILHLSDIHYDPDYLPGATTTCGAIICCQAESGTVLNPADKAGYWGDYRACDLPFHTIEAQMAEIKNRISSTGATVVYYTGDIVDHAMWKTSETRNKASLTKVFELFKTTFADVEFYPVIGNHEPSPVNTFSQPSVTGSVSTQWLYDHLETLYADYLPADALATVKSGGYYTVLSSEGHRVIVLNNNLCFTLNWWSFTPAGITAMKDQLQWLQDTLKAAETAGEFVHILGHIPPNENKCYQSWALQYRKIIERYYKIISGTFYGHTHYSEINIMYSTNNRYALAVGFNAGGLSPFKRMNPGYAVYYVDDTEFIVNEMESYIMPLNTANLNTAVSPTWKKSYSMAADFSLSNLTPATLHTFMASMTKNATLGLKYWKYKVKEGPLLTAPGCNTPCRKTNICSIVANQVDDLTLCKLYGK
jgi:3',5'-cyclic AMP phosphodiesterase CpdA